MNNVATVSDTKRTFYSVHSRPISPLYRRVIEELLVEIHLLSVNVGFVYDPIYALGVVSGYDRFMEGYRPEADQASMFGALCSALNANPEQYRQDAQTVLDCIGSSDLKTVVSWLSGNTAAAPSPLKETVESIAQRKAFKYSRLFAIGMYNLLEKADPEFAKQKESERLDMLTRISEGLNLPLDKLQKDVDGYVRNLDNMAQAKEVMREAVEAERKKREKREQEKKDRAAAKAAKVTESESQEPKTEEPSSKIS